MIIHFYSAFIEKMYEKWNILEKVKYLRSLEPYGNMYVFEFC